MSSTRPSIQDREVSPDLQKIGPNSPDNFLKSQSQEKQAIVAAIVDVSESTYLSPSQQSAIETLRDLKDSTILGLLSLIRLPGYARYPSPEGLSDEELHALSHLNFCPDTHILLWLRSSRGQEQRPSSDT